MKKRLVAASTDPNGLMSFGSQMSNNLNDVTSQPPDCPFPPKPCWSSESRQQFTAPTNKIGAGLATSSKSECPPGTVDENRNSVSFVPPVTNQNQSAAPKKPDLNHVSVTPNQFIEALLHNPQLASRGLQPQHAAFAQLLFEEMTKNQLAQQQQQSRTHPQRATPDKLLITSRSPPLRSPPEPIRGYVDNAHSRSRTSFTHSPALQSPSPHPFPPPSRSSGASRNPPSRPLTASEYNTSPSSSSYNHQLRLPTPADQQVKNHIDKVRQTAPLASPQMDKLYSTALLYLMANQQPQQQQLLGHTSQHLSFPPHSDNEKKLLIDYSKVGSPLSSRAPKSDLCSSQMRPQSSEPYTRPIPPPATSVDPAYYPWPKTEPSSSSCSFSSPSNYSTIDILRESKQASESMKPTNKLLTTSGVFYPEKQQTAHPPPAPPSSLTSSIKKQSDAVDHHFRMALSNSRGNSKPESPSLGNANLDGVTVEGQKNPPPISQSSSMAQAVHHGVSSCSSSSSINSMTLLDRDANSPGRKPFLLPPPKSENRINNEACKFSLKKRLIQRYQADATTELAAESAAAKQVNIPEKQQQQQQQTKPEPGANSTEKSEPSIASYAFLSSSTSTEVPKVKEECPFPSARESPASPVVSPSVVNGSDLTPSKDSADTTTCFAKRGVNYATRRHPPVRASKIAPLMCSLSETSLPSTMTASSCKRARGSVAKQHYGVITARKRTTASRSSRTSRTKTNKPRFYNNRVSSPAAASDTAIHGGSRNRTTSVRSTTEQAQSEFYFNGQDEDGESMIVEEAGEGSRGATTNRRWFGTRKRKSNSAFSGPPLRVKVSRRFMEEGGPAKRPRWSKRSLTTRSHGQSKTAPSALLRNYAEVDEESEDEGEERRAEGEKAYNTADLDTTIRADQENFGEEVEEEDGRGESLICRRCGQSVRAIGSGHQTDRFDFQCCEEKLSLEEIRKRLPPPPDLAVLSHRSLCGGELGGRDSDAVGSDTEVPFLQLNSCTELEKLKPSFRCRACREACRLASTTTVETNTSSDTSSPKNNARRRGIHNRNHSASRGNGEPGGDSKAALATVSVFCRFWGFRKLCYDNKGLLGVADFCRTSEADAIDRSLWAMHHRVSPSLSRHNAIYCLERLGAVACRLMLSELSILSSSTTSSGPVIRQCCPTPANSSSRTYISPSLQVAWKRPVQGVREMCDVCETTMFNSHWVCTKCGYSVCSACYYAKATSYAKAKDSPDPLGDATSSVASTTQESVADDDGIKCLSSSVVELSYEDYSVRQPWSTCSASRRPHDPCKMMLTALLPYGSLHRLWHRLHRIVPRLDCPCACASAEPPPNTSYSPASSTDTSAATSLDLLADLALKSTASSGDGSPEDGAAPDADGERRECNQKAGSPGVLYLRDGDSGNSKAFQRHWATNQPVVVTGCEKHFNASLWTPRSLSRESSSSSHIVLVDCETNLIVPRHPVRAFWEAFEPHPNNSKRSSAKESTKSMQHLKIREWPPLGDLAELHPDRYADFTAHLPIPEYTHREGELNLAARLPSFFVRPDLGPRLHIAHDLSSQPKVGTMNLRVDVTDVINVLMYTSRSTDQAPQKAGEGQLRAFLKSAGVDVSEVNGKCISSASSARGLPGALWHVFRPCDLPALRDYLTKLNKSSASPQYRGSETASNRNSSAHAVGGDVIHDQRMYLSQQQLEDLKAKTGIKPYTVLQFLGDAVFIPAGSVHQVRNLANCVNVSSDFISPEHVPQCLELTEEFRRLPRNHPCHEDKLQVKNMIYHTVKDALSTVLDSETTDH
uniref:JmjC domain-containing protein n=1 Tax=Mesocestoides corti TaxID=53468 RepID=A0A5K3FEF6_MESCO